MGRTGLVSDALQTSRTIATIVCAIADGVEHSVTTTRARTRIVFMAGACATPTGVDIIAGVMATGLVQLAVSARRGGMGSTVRIQLDVMAPHVARMVRAHQRGDTTRASVKTAATQVKIAPMPSRFLALKFLRTMAFIGELGTRRVRASLFTSNWKVILFYIMRMTRQQEGTSGESETLQRRHLAYLL